MEQSKVRFSIIVVCFNAGDKLKYTLDNIYAQEYWNYQVIIKDGESTDGSLDALIEAGYFEERIGEVTNIVEGKDKGIYDAMNIAVGQLNDHVECQSKESSYVIFMNCGDSFCDRQTLGHVADEIAEHGEMDEPVIFYGDQFNMTTNTYVTSSPKLNEFSLYRNVPCHQVCFYDGRLFKSRAYNTDYKVRADYEHFLYCVYEEHARTIHMDGAVSKYEGGGFSETKTNREVSAKEHCQITDKYMGARARRYRLIMTLTGAGIRTKMAESKYMSGLYNAIKSFVYGLKK